MERVPDGDDVVAFLSGLGVREGTWVAGVGSLTDGTLAVPGDEGESVREVAAGTQLLSLAGPAEGPLMAILATRGGERSVIGGRLIRGRSAGVTLFLTPSESVPCAAEVPEKPDVRASAALPDDDDEADEAPKYGDRVEHFVFGLCDVMVVREERMKIRDAKGGKLREIHLRAVKVLKPTIEGGYRVFKLARRN